MLTAFKKITVSFLLFLVLFSIVAPNFLIAKAAPSPTPAPTGTWYNSDFKTWYSKVYDDSNPSEIFGERYTAAQVQWVIYSVWAFIFNIVVPQHISACIFENSLNVTACFKEIQSLLSDSSLPNSQNGVQNAYFQPKSQNLWSLVFATDRPFSGIAYVKNKIQNFSPVASAYAAGPGFGFDALQPVQSMWSAFRNIAFGLFVLAAIAFSFMIMFRVKISPQVVITVQSAIPKLIISLILVTFSYAIAGFAVDLMYVVIGMISALAPSLLAGTAASGFANPAYIFNFLTTFNVLIVLFLYIVAFVISFILIIFTQLGVILSAAIGGAVFLLLSPILVPVVILLAICIVLTALWVSLKTIWTLTKAFTNVLLLTIFGPIQIVFGTLFPNFGFGTWLRNLASALSTFVVAGALMLFSWIFLVNALLLGWKDFLLGPWLSKLIFGSVIVSDATGQAVPGWPPLLSGGGTDASVGLLFLGVSFVLFTMIPKAAELIQSAISGKPFAYGTAINEALAGARWGYKQSGYQDTWEQLQTARRNRQIAENIGTSAIPPGRYSVWAKRYVGGANAGSTIDATLGKNTGVNAP